MDACAACVVWEQEQKRQMKNEDLSNEKSPLLTKSQWLEPPETFDDFNRYVGINVQRYRREACMSRKFLASLSTISPSTLAKIERGQLDPRLSSICYLSQALDTTVYDLLSAPPRLLVLQHQFIRPPYWMPLLKGVSLMLRG